jgi:hypothetical protein
MVKKHIIRPHKESGGDRKRGKTGKRKEVLTVRDRTARTADKRI